MTNPVAPDYEAAMRTFRAKREAALRADDGLLSATALTVLVEGPNVLPFGIVTVKTDSVRAVIRDGVTVTRQGEPVRDWRLRPDQDEDVLSQGRISHQLIRRGDALLICTRDADNPLRKNFRGADWFPVNRGLRLNARAVPLEHPRTRELDYSVAAKETTVTDYVLVFELGGVAYSVEPVIEPKRLLVQFRDLTNGESTSDIGRYLYAPLPHGGKTIVDFNQALTPGSAYNPHVISMVPPKRSTIYVRVEAGEKMPRSNDDDAVLPEAALASG